MATRTNGKTRRKTGSRGGGFKAGTAPIDDSTKRVTKVGRAGGRGRKGHGTLVIIGGHEDKEGDSLILRALCRRAGTGRLVVATVASGVPDEVWADYEPLFRRLGCRHVHHLKIERREEALEERALKVLQDAQVVFFTGGDQLKITSQLGDTPIYARLRDIFERGGTLAGTSAGASVMSETMMVAGEGEATHRIGGNLRMAAGFGFIDDVIIDQHFAERGRMGRLMAAVAQNPRLIGLGIDENTAIVVNNRRNFEVIGEGGVYVVDGRRVSFSNLAEEASDRALSVFDVKLHVLSQGDKYDLRFRKPSACPAEEVEKRELEDRRAEAR